MKSTARLIVFACVASFFSYSCSESPVAEPIVPVKKVDPLPLENQWAGPAVADFKMILPKGNQIVADGVDQLAYDFIFYDNLGFPITYSDYSKFFTKVKVNGVETDFKQAIKSTTLGKFDIEITINKITKTYPVIATTADKKVVEIPIIFNFVSTDYSDKVVDLTFTNLVETYKRNGLDNVVFKLAEIDNDGKPLARKGVKFWNYSGVATDQMDYKKLWGNKYAFDVYLIENKTVDGASAYTDRSSIVIDNSFFRQPVYIETNRLETIGFPPFNHEMGHVLGLKHVYRDDNLCQVQEGVNDIQAFNWKTSVWNVKTQRYSSNCGGETPPNVMGYSGGPKESAGLTPDQIKVAKKAALSVNF